MAVFKCKMCGGSLDIHDGSSVVECEYCGTQQTLPRLEDDRRANLYDRASHFRRSNEFDKAMAIYEQILNEDNTDAEAYWSLVLCRYGIEYVEDPVTHKRIHTVNRMQYTSVLADENYKSALQYADGSQRAIYMEEAESIDRIQKGILAISQKEEPFDVFICYKETDSTGRRTHDSVLAQELYNELRREGFKVFFSRVTLEDKLGTAYEPYIFAALNSAKVMVVIGTKPEHFNAVWVKNEWSRYLAMIRNGDKKMLIPAYRDMDPYDMPEEFSHLQAQDMSKLGFMQDLVRGIKKIAKPEEPKVTVTVNAPAGGAEAQGIEPLLRRAAMFLEDNDWENASSYCERVLDRDPECGRAYVLKLMARVRVSREEELAECMEPLDALQPYKNAVRFSDAATAERLTGYSKAVNDRLARMRAEEQARIREEQERRDREERRRAHISNLQKKRADLISNANSRGAQKAKVENQIAEKEKLLKCFPNLVAVRILAIFSLLLGFVNMINFFRMMQEESAIALWAIGSFAFIVLVGVLAGFAKHSWALTLFNFLTLGIFGAIFSFVMFIKSFTGKKKNVEADIYKLRMNVNQIETEIAGMQNDIAAIDAEIANYSQASYTA